MNEQRIFRIALVVGIIGIFLLTIISRNVEPVEIEVCEVNEGLVGKVIGVSGEFVRLREISGGYSFVLKDGGCEVRCVFFGEFDDVDDVFESAGVTGKVQMYNGVLEIMADKVLEF